MIKLSSTENDQQYEDFIGQNWYVVREVRDVHTSTPTITERAFCSIGPAMTFFNEHCEIANADYHTDTKPIDYRSFRIVYPNSNQELFQISLMSFQQLLATKMSEWIKKELKPEWIEGEQLFKQPLFYPHVVTLYICNSGGFAQPFQNNVLFKNSPAEFIGWVKTVARLDIERFVQILVNQIKSPDFDMGNIKILYVTDEPFGTLSIVIRDGTNLDDERLFSKEDFIESLLLPF